MFRTFRAVKFLFVGPLILAMLLVINLMTDGHLTWFKWAALGIGIAWVVNLLRVARAVVIAGGLAAVLAYFYQRKQRNDQVPR
ncbi:MAG: hypothetical protein U0V87_05115 [Acidobacteriota bacterium]